MPEEFDLRKYGWVTPVKNQGFMGSCWAFGNMAALESSLLRYTNNTYSLSVNNMQNSMLQYSKYGVDTIKEGGNAFSAVAYLIDWLGVFPDEYDGYDELGKISSLFITPEDIHIQNVVIIPPIKNATDKNLIKNALINYGAVSASHCANFDESKYFNKSSSAQYCYDVNESTHRICIVGWDDNYSRYNFLKTPEGDGAWIVKNSWGTDWGDEGYFYLSYYDTSFADKESVCYIINNDQYTRIYQHDVGGESKWIPESKYYASIFTADDDELIGAVGTVFNKSGREYEFTITVNDVDVYTQKGISKISGYETIKLE
jgi:C1A family cysteine protease